MAIACLIATLRSMNRHEPPTANADTLEPDPLLTALLRHATAQADAEPPHSICAHCGRRVDGTSKRRYCGPRALLIRRRQARTRMSQLLRR